MTTLITKKEWLSIFPEAVSYLEEDLIYQLNKYDRLVKEMESQMDMVERLNLTQEQKEFHAQVREYFIEADIKNVERRIKDIDRYLIKNVPTNKITNEDIERAKEYDWNNLIKLKRGFAKCPFHNEKTASFSINKKTNHGHCFGCGWTGDTIDFIQKLEGLNFLQAVNALK